MGFFSSIGNAITGKTPSTQQTTTGFGALPTELQTPYKTFGTQIQKLLTDGNLASAYKPADFNAGERAALDKTYAGFAPDAASLSSDIAMQTNPFDSSVIDTINREAGGDYSILKQNANEAGQMGSNRVALGANDIDLTRLNQIGTFKQQNFQQALQNALTTLPTARRVDAAGAMDAGSAERTLGLQQATAPVTAMQQIGAALGILPSGTSSQTTGSPGTGSDGMTTIKNVASIAAAFSDIRLKCDILPLGEHGGHRLHEFSYREGLNLPTGRFIGVMAHEVEQYAPEAVSEADGFKMVNYLMLGLEMREAA